MFTSHPRKLKIPPPPISKVEAFGHELQKVIATFPDEARYVGWAFISCSRCRNDLRCVRLAADDAILILFCPTCHWFNCDSQSRPWREAMRRAALLPRDCLLSPDRPLERDIQKHLQSLRRKQ